MAYQPAHGLTVSAVARAGEGDRILVPDLLMAPELADGWVNWAVEQAVKGLQRDPSDHRLRLACAVGAYSAALTRIAPMGSSVS